MFRSKRFDWLDQLPNQITVARMATVPLLLFLYPLNIKNLKVFCGFIFMLAALSDWLDGFIARKFNLESKIGALLDPIADKLITTVALVLLASAGIMWPWMAGLLLCREVAMSGLRLVAMEQGVDIKVSLLGKWKTLFLDVALVCLLVDQQLFGWPFWEVGMVSLWLAFGTSYYSAYLYVRSFIQSSPF
jgi:CDP-diacylglycerol--glycerol-3-phosphate 3-phosphatidyltransferase